MSTAHGIPHYAVFYSPSINSSLLDSNVSLTTQFSNTEDRTLRQVTPSVRGTKFHAHIKHTVVLYTLIFAILRSSRSKWQCGLKADSHIPCRSPVLLKTDSQYHAVPLPC